MISRICELPTCFKTFQAREADVKRGMNKYCSRACSHAGRRLSPKKAETPNVECSWCGIGIYRSAHQIKVCKSKQFYCCTGHAGLDAGSGGLKTGPEATDKLVPFCACGRKYTGKLNKCRACVKADLISAWLNGNMSVTRHGGQSSEPRPFVKEYLKETRGDCCEVCGFDELAPDGRSIIQMDHIDGDHMNNAIDNLKLLCPNHHAMTPTFGSRNKNSTRAYRRNFTYEDKIPAPTA